MSQNKFIQWVVQQSVEKKPYIFDYHMNAQYSLQKLQSWASLNKTH